MGTAGVPPQKWAVSACAPCWLPACASQVCRRAFLFNRLLLCTCRAPVPQRPCAPLANTIPRAAGVAPAARRVRDRPPPRACNVCTLLILIPFPPRRHVCGRLNVHNLPVMPVWVCMSCVGLSYAAGNAPCPDLRASLLRTILSDCSVCARHRISALRGSTRLQVTTAFLLLIAAFSCCWGSVGRAYGDNLHLSHARARVGTTSRVL